MQKTPNFGSTTREPMVYEVYCCYILLSIMQQTVCKFIVMIWCFEWNIWPKFDWWSDAW